MSLSLSVLASLIFLILSLLTVAFLPAAGTVAIVFGLASVTAAVLSLRE